MGELHYLALIPNRVKPGTLLIEIVLARDPLYIYQWTGFTYKEHIFGQTIKKGSVTPIVIYYPKTFFTLRN